MIPCGRCVARVDGAQRRLNTMQQERLERLILQLRFEHLLNADGACERTCGLGANCLGDFRSLAINVGARWNDGLSLCAELCVPCLCVVLVLSELSAMDAGDFVGRAFALSLEFVVAFGFSVVVFAESANGFLGEVSAKRDSSDCADSQEDVFPSEIRGDERIGKSKSLQIFVEVFKKLLESFFGRCAS